MADVGEKATLDLIKFEEFLVAFLELAAVLIQLKTQTELAKAQPIEEVIATDNDYSGQRNEIDMGKEKAELDLVCCFGEVRGEIQTDDPPYRKESFANAPM